MDVLDFITGYRFVEITKNILLESNDYLDVESLFTNIPVQDTLIHVVFFYHKINRT